MIDVELNAQSVSAVGVKTDFCVEDDHKVLRVVKSPDILEFDEPTFAKLNGVRFEEGIIEVDVLSRLLGDAPDFARGFIGVAFAISDSNNHFECMYIRPTNGMSTDPIRKFRAVQYFAYPDYKYDILRQGVQNPYETSADIGLDKWINLKIVVNSSEVSLYLDRDSEAIMRVPRLVAGIEGGVALWCDVGTEAFFKNLKIKNK